MKKLSITTVSLAALALSCVQPAVAGFDNTFVDFAGSDSANTCGVITSPCATLNNALANTNATGSVNILNGGFWGPILITQSVNINAFEGKAVIINDGSAPGCVGAAAGSCGSNGGYAIEIAGTTSTNVKMKGVSIRQGTGSGGALKIGTANQVKLADSNLRGSSSATLPMLISSQPTVMLPLSSSWFSPTSMSHIAPAWRFECCLMVRRPCGCWPTVSRCTTHRRASD